jgi:bifunctional non-homologous end joining protein LigD
VLLDGEVVAVDEQGRPSFQALHHQAAHTLVYYTFDVLHLDGRDLTTTPLDERRELLALVPFVSAPPAFNAGTRCAPLLRAHALSERPL